MTEIRTYAAARRIKPATVLQLAARLSGKTWARWEDGSATCTLRTMATIREYMLLNPPVTVAANGEEAA